jgi:hypothetical protein
MNDRCLGGTRSSGRSGLSRLGRQRLRDDPTRGPRQWRIDVCRRSRCRSPAGKRRRASHRLILLRQRQWPNELSSSPMAANSGSPHLIRARRPAICYSITASSPTSALICCRKLCGPREPAAARRRSLSRTGSDRRELAERRGLDRIAHGLPVFPSRGRGGERDRQARSRTFCRATAMIGDPVGAIARQDATRYFHAGRTGETLFRSQPGERHSCIEIQLAGT